MLLASAQSVSSKQNTGSVEVRKVSTLYTVTIFKYSNKQKGIIRETTGIPVFCCSGRAHLLSQSAILNTKTKYEYLLYVTEL